MDWKDILGQLKDDPSLPQGDDSIEENPAPSKKKKETLHVLIEKKGRKGKTATIIEGFTIPDDEVAEIAAMLKKKLGVGGSARGGEILIQGDLAAKVKEILRAEGFKVK